MDNVILQKILPRIQGSSGSIKRVLIDLFKVCINNSTQLFSYDNIGIYEEMSKYILNSKPISYKKSAEKIAFMMRRFEEDGFTSYWQ
jgi:DNA-directed RNA polymerase alpha subunit